MGLRGPKSDSKMKTEWSMICVQILRESGMSFSQAEQHFGVGNGSGRTWRYWVDGERLARQFTREDVISRAKEEGFLTPASIAAIQKMAAGADVSALPYLEVPEIPADAEVRPEEAAIFLWQWIRKRKAPRFLAAIFRLYGIGSEYRLRAEQVENQINRLDLDDMTALAWIKASYIRQASLA